MNADQFSELVKQVTIGKKLPDAIYLHKAAFAHVPEPLMKFISIVAKALKIPEEKWDLVKLQRKHFGLSLLSYPTFFTDSYPALHTSITVDLSKLSHKVTHYDQSDNPPILHRKETMLHPSHESCELFKAITEEGERAGLYENTRVIGFKKSWERIIQKKGYTLVDGRLFRSSTAAPANKEEEGQIDRHKTAIVRHDLSAPMKSLAKHGFLNGEHSVFDYGCGRGDDLRELEAHGLDAIGWDPNFRPDAPKMASDLVNLGFVINVIEDQDERIEALQGAWELADKLLVVSVMLGSEGLLSQFQPYKDGIITSRNTFQKYYTQSEIGAYIERVIEEPPVAVAPGIFYVFKDKAFEQQFLQNRHKRHYKWQQLTSPEPVSETQTKLLFTQHAALLERFWLTCLAYGRCPANEEFEQSDALIAHIGSHKKAFNLVCSWFDSSELEQAEQMRREDLLVYFALDLFGKRKPYTQQPEDLKRDIKALFGTYKIAQTQAQELLFTIADTALIEAECLKAHKLLPASVLNHEEDAQGQAIPHSLLLHKQFVDQLSPILRVYIYAALQLFGELEDIQLIKIHIHSGKVTLLGYEAFHESPIPALSERIKIKMAEQEVDVFDYIKPERRQILLNKIDFIDDTFDEYKKQKTFNQKLARILKTLPDVKSLRVSEFSAFLETQNMELSRFQLREKKG